MILNSDALEALWSLPRPAVNSVVDDLWGVEGLYSQQFSVGIFFFLIICIIVFTAIVVKFMNSGARSSDTNQDGKGLKSGEKVLFVWIFFGIAAAVVMAVVQLLQGYLI